MHLFPRGFYGDEDVRWLLCLRVILSLHQEPDMPQNKIMNNSKQEPHITKATTSPFPCESLIVTKVVGFGG